jgi:hypothetical protein
LSRATGFDGKEHLFNYIKNESRRNNTNKSSLHKEAKVIIKELFSQYSVYEEVTLPGSRKSANESLLFTDFYLPRLALVVEVHGKQHYEYTPFFHKSKMHYFKCRKRDADKVEWCELNSIDVVELPYNRKKEWKKILQNARPIQ